MKLDWVRFLRNCAASALFVWAGATVVLYIAGEIAAPWSR